jgi:hypothetical protein
VAFEHVDVGPEGLHVELENTISDFSWNKRKKFVRNSDIAMRMEAGDATTHYSNPQLCDGDAVGRARGARNLCLG